jgi:hypothetical protein
VHAVHSCFDQQEGWTAKEKLAYEQPAVARFKLDFLRSQVVCIEQHKVLWFGALFELTR